MRWTATAMVCSGAMMWAGAMPALAAGPRVVVSPPSVEGPTAEHIEAALAAGARDGLADAGVEVAEAPEGCADATCLAEEVSAGRAQAVLNTTVTITDSDYALVAELVDGSGNAVAREEGSCEICTYEEAAAALRELTAKAVADLGPPPATTGTVMITSDPPGATVYIDGSEVGATPHRAELDAGSHTVELSLEGHERVQQSVEVQAGQEQPVELLLPESAGSTLSPRTMEIISWSAIGVGAAALAGGITLLVLDNNPVKSNCSGATIDADGDCAFRYDTLGGGIGLTVGGLVLAGGGVGLLLYARKKRGGAQEADVALVPGGIRARF